MYNAEGADRSEVVERGQKVARRRAGESLINDAAMKFMSHIPILTALLATSVAAPAFLIPAS